METASVSTSSNSLTVPSTEGKEYKVYNTFDDMNLSDNLLRGIYGHGFEKPSPIQQRGIKPIAEGSDILAQAQSGT